MPVKEFEKKKKNRKSTKKKLHKTPSSKGN